MLQRGINKSKCGLQHAKSHVLCSAKLHSGRSDFELVRVSQNESHFVDGAQCHEWLFCTLNLPKLVFPRPFMDGNWGQEVSFLARIC